MSNKKTIRQVADTIGIKGELKKEQVNAIKDGLDDQDLFMIAPTSFGKSAIFQILAIMEGGLTIVIVPTLSLLHDQVDQLQQRQLSVGALASDCMSYDEFGIQRALKQYGYLILYTTPESLWKLDLSDIPVSLLRISSWKLLPSSSFNCCQLLLLAVSCIIAGDYCVMRFSPAYEISYWLWLCHNCRI